jgi:quinoprotein glucose dehydrogenase
MKKALFFVAGLALFAADPGQRKNQSWPVSGGGPEGMRYSPLDQINRGNVRALQQAWRFDSGDEYEGSELQCNPIIIDGVLYAATPRLRIISLDAATGKLLWDFDARRGETVKGKQRNRALTYWADGNDRRIFFGLGHWLYALDARTGQPVKSFGDNGRIDLREGLGRDPEGLTVQANSPGVVYRDMLILGMLTSEDLPSAPGFVRAFDVRTGKIRWVFRTIPQPGEFGYETWPKDAWTYTGGANSWPGMALDERRGLVFVPTGSAAFDFYGSNRAGDNLFANCLLALDAATGKRVWHFQFVRHDVWDRDLPSPPTLVQVRRDGKLIDAVAQITKSGHVWVFDRATGKSLFPFEEREVQASDVEGEALAEKQVLPLLPKPFARQQLTEDMLTQRTPEAHQAALARFRTVRSGGQFAPPSLQGTIVFPGFDGGGEWGGPTWDPKTGLLYVNSNEMAWILRLVPRSASKGRDTGSSLYTRNCAGCHRADRKGTPPEFPSLTTIGEVRTRDQVTTTVRDGAGRMPGFARLGDGAVNAIVRFIMTGEDLPVSGAERNPKAIRSPLKYGIDGYNKFLDPDGYPAIAPPWGTLNAINLNTGEYAWKIPFGEIPDLAAKGLTGTGSENYGGSVVTAGGLLFIGATNFDRLFRAYDKENGKLLWQTTLPAAGNATPAVYAVNGRQYVVIAAGGGKSGQPSGGSYVAFALPEKPVNKKP